MPEPGREAVGAASPETARSAFASPMASTLYAAGVVTRPRRNLGVELITSQNLTLSSCDFRGGRARGRDSTRSTTWELPEETIPQHPRTNVPLLGSATSARLPAPHVPRPEPPQHPLATLRACDARRRAVRRARRRGSFEIDDSRAKSALGSREIGVARARAPPTRRSRSRRAPPPAAPRRVPRPERGRDRRRRR